jgi:hypothetical protein
MAVQETKIKADVLDDNLYIAVQEVKNQGGCKHERDPSMSLILRPAMNFAVTWRLISVLPA